MTVCLPRISPLVLIAGLGLSACTSPAAHRDSAPASTAAVTAPARSGYLDPAALPDSLALLPPPPAPGSAGQALDDTVNAQARALAGSPRFAQAGRDAELSFPAAAGHYACAAGVPIDRDHTPHLYHLLERSLIDASAATDRAKQHYHRQRPFMLNNQPTCAPQDEAALRRNGSYPSGHTAIGWSWALILAEIAPDHADSILARGRSYSESRLICNVHWQSDILEGRFIAASTVARLHADPTFRADLDAAREEIASARKQGLRPTQDCAAEAEVLKVRPASAL